MAALDNIASELLKSANEADLNYKKTRDQAQRDKAVRLRRIVENLRQLVFGGSGVSQIIAGTNITISPAGGTGIVTVNATGGSGTATGYGSFYSNVTQTLAAINTPQAVTLGSTYEANGTSTSGSRIYMDKAGTYQFSYVAQVSNNANSVEYAEFWIKYNGVTYPNSGTRITLAPRKSSTEPSEQLMSLILNGTSLNDNDYIELFWEATSTQVSLKYEPATIDYPATPSIIANIIPIGGGSSSVEDLSDLGDVSISLPTEGQFLVYNQTTSLWENRTAEVAPPSGELDIDGGTFLVPGGGFNFDGGTFT